MAVASVLSLGSTYLFTPNPAILKDGAVWDLTGATVTIIFTPPSPAAAFTRTATITDAAAGVASYQCTTTDLNASGAWARQWHVVQGSIDIKIEPPISFTVQP